MAIQGELKFSAGELEGATMKITVATFSLLLVLALCSQYAEGCTGFYGTFGVLLLGDPSLLALNLEKYGPTEAETQALIKVQECYAESPVKTSLIDALFLVGISIKPECLLNLPTKYVQNK